MDRFTGPGMGWWIVVLVLTHLHGGTIGGAEEQSGTQQSPKLNITAIQQFPTQCPTHCKDQFQYNSICREGCREWRRGLKDGCGVVCVSKDGNFREFHSCQVGCSKVVDEYYFYLAGVLGVPEGPTLISSSLEHSSLGLTWEGIHGGTLPHLEFIVQQRVVGRTQDWEPVLIDPLNSTHVTIEQLRPYTEYQFRIGWVIAQDFPPLYSSESTGILTLAKGLPNAPQITSVQSITNTSVSITWLPPSQPNGPLIAYILKLQNIPDGHLILKEIPIVGYHKSGGYTFSGLIPNTNYSLAISGINREGEGVSKFITFDTPQSQMSNDISKMAEPKLLIQGIREVYVQAIDLLLQPEVSVFVSTRNVTGMSAHFRKNFVFIATGEGEVVRRNLGSGNDTRVILRREKLDMQVTFLSVDWLHDQLYLVGRKPRTEIWTIRRTDLNGIRIHTVLESMGSKPVDFQADPYTGYLYWVMAQSVGTAPAGLYKMDLYQRGHDPGVTPLLEEEGLGPFTLDLTNYRILIVHRTRNTVYSVSLDGEKTDIRGNTQSPNWAEVVSIGNYGGVFYWTTGQSIVAEEYNPVQRAYYHNSYEVAKSHQPCSRLLLVHPSLQPTPAPMAPPINVQAVFSHRRARLSWKPPPQIAGLGEGSWRGWRYGVTVSPNVSIVFSDINDTHLIINDLEPDTQYGCQVLAYSESGQSPPSAWFKGQTLESSNLSFIWGSASGRIYSTDPLGSSVQPLVYEGGSTSDEIMSLTASPSKIFFSLQNGSAFEYCRATGDILAMPSVTFAQSMAFEPVGSKLYWSNPKKQAILRLTLNPNETSAVEYLPVLTTALQIVLDSNTALLFWTTGHAVQVARLNGRNQETLVSVGLFSGIRILSISVDIERERVFWLTRRTTGGSSLFEKSYKSYSHGRGDDKEVEVVKYDEGGFKGPIFYYSQKILVLESVSEAIIQDLKGVQAKALIPVKTIANISTLLVIGTETQFNASAAPPMIFPWSVTLTGKWNSFTIMWQPVAHSKAVFYDVTINSEVTQSTSQTFLRIDNRRINSSSSTPYFEPYSELEISISAATYWSAAKPTTVKRRTPSGKPSPPLNPRVFITRLKYPYVNGTVDQLSGEVRWDPPAEPNGLINGYVVHCWKGRDKVSDSFVQVDQTQLTGHLGHVRRHAVYHVGIEAYTNGGVGRMSRKIVADSEKGQDLTRILVTTGDKVETLDIDRNVLDGLRTPYNPYTVAYYALEQTLYCFDEGKHLFRSTFKGANKTRILTLSDGAIASNLKVNWISRKLFWISESAQGKEKYTIQSLDLERLEDGLEIIVESTNPIVAMAVNPFTSQLLWTTVARTGIVTLNSAQDDGMSPGSFLKTTRSCNCSTIRTVGEPIVLDTSQGHGLSTTTRILFIEPTTSLIWSADEEGCVCVPLVNSSTGGKPWKLTADRGHVYWVSSQSHSSDGLYVGEKFSSGLTQLRSAFEPGIREIATFGPNHQPFPGRECLIPVKLEVDEAILLNRSAHSLTLKLPTVETHNCTLDKLSLPVPSYSIYYAKVDDNGLTPCTKTSLTLCHSLTTTESPVTIEDLQPYTSYTLFFSVKTYYSDREGLQALDSTPVVLTTAPGPPLPPTLIQLSPRSPTSIKVKWTQPEKLNGRKVWYAIEWERVGSKGAPNQMWAAAEGVTAQNDTELELNVTKLRPGKKYAVWVVAYSELGDEFSKSDMHTIETLGFPNNLSLILATPHQLSVGWTAPNYTYIIKHEFIYREGWSAEWKETGVNDLTCAGCSYNVTILGLRPKTTYGFRLRTWYAGEPTVGYTWPVEMSQFDLETLADKPDPPGIPIVRRITTNRFDVAWEKSEGNGGQVEIYSLEGRFKPASILSINGTRHRRKTRDETEAQKFVAAEIVLKTEPFLTERWDWAVLYNGTECHWELTGMDVNSPLELRVRSKNVYGWSPYSRPGSVSSLSELLLVVAEPQNFGLVVGSVFLCGLVVVTVGLIAACAFRRNQKEKSALGAGTSPMSTQRREMELATLRELPGRIHQNNILYAADLFLEFDSEGLEMPKVKRSQITFLKHLGSGAFGDVYEGFATNLRPTAQPIPTALGSRVAIKTLRKGASTKEKVQFVEEARLMGQFHHPHILELLGICLDADPCLVLELMTGGDLLSHLRSTRLTPTQTQFQFRLGDLVDIAIQVARGCVYLEEKHFVHRDLAARNCLVRLDPHPEGGLERIVKIGDFGLARDVYRNDYYRKEGEGLLPVRWMPPESLVDGVFTTQSDVWSFGILLWEILTRGEQPYPARSNVEVLNFVRMGGRLREPPNSPLPLTWLMFRCWEFEPTNRPMFKEILHHLLNIASTLDDSESQDREREERVSQNPPYQNTGVLRDETWLSLSPQDDVRLDEDEDDEPPVFPQYTHAHAARQQVYTEDDLTCQGTFPKYLEVVGNWTEVQPNNPGFPMGPPPQIELTLAVNDGYEIPVKPQPHQQSFDLLAPPPPYPTTAPIPAPRTHFHSTSTSSSDRESGTEGRTLLGSTTSEEETWRVDQESYQSTNYGQADQASSYTPFTSMDWNRRTVRAMD